MLRTIGTNELALDVTCKASRFLVVNSAYFPGWQAEIDGRRTEIIRTNGLVQGVVVPAGNHSVRLAYRPASFRLGVAVSLLAATAVLAGVAVRASWRGAGSRLRSRSAAAPQ